MVWTSLWQQWSRLFLQDRCVLCQRSAPGICCQNCQRQLQTCRLTQPTQAWRSPLPLFAWGTYTGPLKRALAALKYDHQPEMGRLLGTWLAESWLSAPRNSGFTPPTRCIVVPIPLHPDKQKQRGYNQADLIAESFCALTGWTLQTRGLVRSRLTEAQFALSPTARQQNLAGAFQLGAAFSQKRPTHPVLLLDDIYTTGATAQAAVQVLQQAQIPVTGILVVAKPLSPASPTKAKASVNYSCGQDE